MSVSRLPYSMELSFVDEWLCHLCDTWYWWDPRFITLNAMMSQELPFVIYSCAPNPCHYITPSGKMSLTSSSLYISASTKARVGGGACCFILAALSMVGLV